MSKSKNLAYAGAGIALIGILMVAGIITPFPGTTTCVGVIVLGVCVGYYSHTSTGNNLYLGIALTLIGAYIFITRRPGAK